MNDAAVVSQLPAMPVQYEFVSVHRLVGFSYLPDEREIAIDIGRADVAVSLVGNPNQLLAQLDRSTAVGELMLRAFVGQTVGADILKAVDQRATEYATERAKQHGVPGVFLVLRAFGEIVSQETGISRDLGGAVLAFDAVDKEELKHVHQRLVTAALTAAVLAVDQASADLVKVTEGAFFTFSDGRPLYSMIGTVGGAKVSMARAPTDRDASSIGTLTRQLSESGTLGNPSRLLVDALRSGEGRLEAFILAWAALEMLISKHSSGCESGSWVALVPEQLRPEANSLHAKFIAGGHRYYSLADKVRVFALTYSLGDSEPLAAEVIDFKKRFREPLYHQGTFSEPDLPVEAITRLTKRLLRAVLDHALVGK